MAHHPLILRRPFRTLMSIEIQTIIHIHPVETIYACSRIRINKLKCLDGGACSDQTKLITNLAMNVDAVFAIELSN